MTCSSHEEDIAADFGHKRGIIANESHPRRTRDC
jgi:hypothetical protein